MCRLGWNHRQLSAAGSVLFLLRLAPSGYASQARGPIAVELSRRRPAVSSTVELARGSRSRRRLADHGEKVGVVEVIDCENAEYSGKIALGTPPQEFEVILDTGSYLLWVTGTSCTKNCDNYRKYDSSVSSTYVEDGTAFTQSYEDGSEATGILSIDKLTLGGLATTATFGEMTTRSLDGCGAMDGIMGMGLPYSGDDQSVFESIVDEGVVDVPIFSFFVSNIDTDSPTGILTLGGVNQTHYEGCLEWMPVAQNSIPDGFWSIVLQNLKIGSESVLRTSAPAMLDTGTSMVVGPYEDVGFVADRMGAFCISFEGPSSSDVEEVECLAQSTLVELIMIECDANFENLSFFFGGGDFVLTPKELLLPLTDFAPPNPSTASEPWCLVGMMGHSADMWILGDSFLRTFYTAYNVADRSVGLAKATGRRRGNACADDAPISGTTYDESAGGSGSDAGEQDLDGDSSGVTAPEGSGPGGFAGSSSSGGAGAGGDRSASAESGRSEQPGLFAVAAAASLGTLFAVAVCGGVGVLVARRIRRGEHRHTMLGTLGGRAGDLEMSGKGGGGRGVVKGVAVGGGAEEDFLQAGPGGYRGSDNGFGSHRYRVAAEAAGANGNGVGRVTVLGTTGHDDDEEEEEDEVEVDFGVSRESGGATAMGRLGRAFGRGGRSGFAAFGDGEG